MRSSWHRRGFPSGSVGKESTCSVRDTGSIPGSERSPGGRNGHPLQYCLENPTDRGAWRATVHEVTESQTRLSAGDIFQSPLSVGGLPPASGGWVENVAQHPPVHRTTHHRDGSRPKSQQRQQRRNSLSFRAGSRALGFICIHLHPVFSLSSQHVWGWSWGNISVTTTRPWRMSWLTSWIPHWVWHFLVCCCWTWLCVEVSGWWCCWGLGETWQGRL